jgi:hypothetical protein
MRSQKEIGDKIVCFVELPNTLCEYTQNFPTPSPVSLQKYYLQEEQLFLLNKNVTGAWDKVKFIRVDIKNS